jgi:acyl dehydratase
MTSTTTTLAELPSLKGSELMWSQVLTVTDTAMAVNYGLNKVRFPAPVPVGSKVRLTATLTDVEEVKGGLQPTVAALIERDGADEPACIAEPVSRFLS